MKRKLQAFILLLAISLSCSQKSLAVDSQSISKILQELIDDDNGIDSKTAEGIVRVASQAGSYYQINGENLDRDADGKQAFVVLYNLLDALNQAARARLAHANNHGQRVFKYSSLAVALGAVLPYLYYNVLDSSRLTNWFSSTSWFYDVPKNDIAIVCTPKNNKQRSSNKASFFIDFSEVESLFSAENNLLKMEFASNGYRVNPIDKRVFMNINRKQDLAFSNKLEKIIKNILDLACQKTYKENFDVSHDSLPNKETDLVLSESRGGTDNSGDISSTDKSSALSLYEQNNHHEKLFKGFSQGFNSKMDYNFGLVIIGNSAAPFYLKYYEDWTSGNQHHNCPFSVGKEVDLQNCHIYPLEFRNVD